MLTRPSGKRDASALGPDLRDPEAVATLFAALRDADKILLAVSGGPDSTALMLLAHAWRAGLVAQGAQAPQLAVATVDHGLRPESRAEAEAAARAAAEAGFAHEILVWEGEKPKARLQERAREARYLLLAAHARRVGAGVVATAHHAEDQAETILFRLLRGSGLAGLRGMTQASGLHGLVHARPLLGCAKADLVALCEAQGRAFVRDPSNADPRFARARLRAMAPTLEAMGLGRDALLRLGRRAARAEAALARQAQELAAQARRADGTLDLALVARHPGAHEEALLRLVGDEIRRATGGERVRLDRLEALGLRLLDALARQEPLAATLAGAALRLDANAVLAVSPAPPRRAEA
ncbi:tRNA lysidine(34) synthetase TilS [Methylocella sp.]|uniref:tRNA lysidine(34) synthetase TilS n=1 Tax=Methylocella sp. TaxID=1978226 RepID=UPI003782DC98